MFVKDVEDDDAVRRRVTCGDTGATREHTYSTYEMDRAAGGVGVDSERASVWALIARRRDDAQLVS
jgi:hypothetical protein